MMSHQLFLTGLTPPLTSGTTSSTSNPSVPTIALMSWPGPSSLTSPSETPWDMKPMQDMNTKKKAGKSQEGQDEGREGGVEKIKGLHS